MKNSIVKFSLTAFAVLTLAACGSSGGGNDNPSSEPNNPQVIPTDPVKPAQPNKADNATGGALVISGQDNNVQVKNVALTDSNIKKLSIDGREITLAYPGIYAGGWQNINGTSVCCGRYENVRIGAVESRNAAESDILFYNGVTTQNMPVSGSASYKGDSIISGDNLDGADYVTGKSDFNVDFGTKKLAGSITAGKVAPINVNADISGNGFKGSAHSSQFASDGAVEGKFYGNNAAELGGLIKGNDNSWGAAFVGKKQ